MCDKVNLDEIKKIPPEQFKEILTNWMDQKEITKTLQTKMRKQLCDDFQKTEIAKQLESEQQKNLFNFKDYVLDTLQAEHLYNQHNHFTLSVFFTETRHTKLLPNFEKEEHFRFEKGEVQELMDLLGIAKTDKITRRILNSYSKSSNESLLSVILKELIIAHNSTDTMNVMTQTEVEQNSQQQQLCDVSLNSTKSKSKKSSRKKSRKLRSQELKPKKPKKLKEVAVISQNLDRMSNNISIITSKLDDFKQNPSNDESKSIIGYVGTIMTQLNGCIGNFETLCRDIKQINESKIKNYEDWMDDLQNSENGRRFLKKLQKSFTRVMSEEKSKLQKDFHKKLEREKSKLSTKLRHKTATATTYPDTITKEINEIFESSCKMIQNVENENKLFEKSLEIVEPSALKVKSKIDTVKCDNNLNDCQQIHSDANSSIKTDPRYSSTSFEDEK